MTGLPQRLSRSRNLSAFSHMGAIYVFHDLFGYIIEMSPDLLDFLDAFAEPAAVSEVCAAHADRFDGADPRTFVDVFFQYSCLVESEEAERQEVWDRVPVKGRWNVWCRKGDCIVIYTAWGDRPLARHRLSPAESIIWEAIDGDTSMRKLAAEHGRDAVGALVERLTHSDVQALKLSHVPLSFYKGRRDLQPSYLASTMPYARHGSAAAIVSTPGELSPRDYYRDQVSDAEAQFDHTETTLSHLFREPHPALANRSYGTALCDALLSRGWFGGSSARILEVGGGLGYVAEAVCSRLLERGLEVTYRIVELSPALARAQRKRCAALPVEVVEGDVLEIPLEPSSWDVVIANEMIGDLVANQLTLAEVGIAPRREVSARAELLARLGEAGRIIGEYELVLEDAPDPFYLTTGAFLLIEKLAALLVPGGRAILTEFGELSQYPRLSTQLDHPELSIHFGHLQTAARARGLDAEVEFVIDLLEMDRDAEGMATTRSYFRALSAMLADRGVTLRKLGYTRPMFHALIEGTVVPSEIGDVRFDRIEDRLMGLVPHEFKALLLRRRYS